MDEEKPATKKDLDELKAELTVELTGEMGRMEDRLMEKMRDMQTELLRAFNRWQDSIHLRMRHLEVNASNDTTAVKARMDVMERRLVQIERKLLLEPPSE